MSKYVRYIDAEEFRDDICRQTEFIQVDDFQVIPVVDVVNCLFNAPTVKAIPIEWIERKLAEHWYVDYDIRELLDDWEKENEN